MTRPVAILALALGALVAGGAPVRTLAQTQAADAPLVTDLSAHLIAITSSFTGTELLLFGAAEEAGDIVVVVRGPTGPTVVRRKDRVVGIWLNRHSVEFESVPGYYAVAASRPIQQIASQSLLARLQIGAENLRFRPRGDLDETEVLPFREAILRNKLRQQLYQEEVGRVVFLGPKLFRTRVAFPSTVPVGTYRAEVYLIRNDRVIAAQSTPLFINKLGFEQAIYAFAHELPLLYGLAAVATAVFAGWAASAVFRKA